MEKKEIIKIGLIVLLFASVATGAFFVGQRISLPGLLQRSTLDELVMPGETLKDFREQILPNFLLHSRLSVEDFEAESTHLRALVMEQDPQVALEELNRLTETREVQYDCSNLLYAIGHASYEKYTDLTKALSYQNTLCGYAGFHGALGAYFETMSDPSSTTMRQICDGFSEERKRGECYHQLGHSLLHLYAGDVPRTLAGCDILGEETLVRWCDLGVFHQHFAPHEGPAHSAYMSSNDPLDSCREVRGIHRYNCYQMAAKYYVSVQGKGFSNVLDWCRTISAPYDTWCVSGAVWELTQYTHDLGLLEQFCISGTTKQMPICIAKTVDLTLAAGYPGDRLQQYFESKLLYPKVTKNLYLEALRTQL